MYNTLSTSSGSKRKRKVKGSCAFRMKYDVHLKFWGTEEDFRYELYEWFGRERPIFWETIKNRFIVFDLLSITCKNMLEAKYDEFLRRSLG